MIAHNIGSICFLVDNVDCKTGPFSDVSI